MLSLASCPNLTHPPSYPPSLSPALLSEPSMPHDDAGTLCGIMRALTPAGLARSRQVSPLTPLCLPDIPSPTTSCARMSLSQSPQRIRSDLQGGPGFATNEQARRYTPPNRVRPPTGCPFASSCFPPRLMATQLPSATYVVTPYGTDLHRADKASSRTHSFPRKRESIGDASLHEACCLLARTKHFATVKQFLGFLARCDANGFPLSR